MPGGRVVNGGRWFSAGRLRGRGAVGIFHEPSAAASGELKSVYVDMSEGFSLGGAVGPAVVRAGRQAAGEPCLNGSEVAPGGETSTLSSLSFDDGGTLTHPR